MVALAEISDRAFADLILSTVDERNRKVALISFKVSKLLEEQGIAFSEETFCNKFDHCLAILVAEGALKGFGNLQNWRFSEICLPD